MSLILDALRKSEAERRKAQVASDALAEVARAPSSPLSGVPAWAWPTVALVAVALTAWLWLGRPAGTGASPPAPPADVGVGEGNTGAPTFPGSNASDAALGLPTAAAGDAPPSVARQRITPSATTTGSTTPLVAANVPAATQVAAPSSAPRASAAAIPAAATLPAHAATAQVLAAPPVAVRTPSPAMAVPVPSQAPSHDGETAAAPPREPAAPAPSSPYSASSPLRLSDLSTADRQQLPPLKMSLHMWGAEAGKRFAIIDGNRVGEGDRVGDAVVAAIDQDGVVLAWNGIRLRVPVR